MIALQERYIPLMQKPNCCNITCLNMILYRRLQKLYEQDYLADYFDLKISKDQKDMFSVDLETYSEIGFDEGLKTIEAANQINKFFDEHQLPLYAKTYFGKNIVDVHKLITDHLKQDLDMWIEYRLDEIVDGYTGMHDGLIESIDEDTITIIDPSPRSKNRFTTSLEVIKRSIDGTYGRRQSGIIVIGSK